MLNEAFLKLKNNLELNKSFDETVQQKHNAVRSVLENNLLNIETKLIGSLQRKTRIQPRLQDDFDIDILVVLGKFNAWTTIGGITPKDAIKSVYNGIEQSERYNTMNPQIDEPTITFEYKKGDVKIELVPAYKDNIGNYPNGTFTIKGRGYWIPKNGSWQLADYDHEAEYITKMNNISDTHLIPTIKMLKAIKRTYFPEMSSFHLEILSSQIIPLVVSWRKTKGYQFSYSALITNFFTIAKNILHLPVKMDGSYSSDIKLDSSSYVRISQTFNKLNDYFIMLKKQPNDKAKIQGWREIFDDLIPLS